MKKAVVIGAGVAGLASANLLAKQGYEVTVLEKNSSTGGRGRQWEKNGYKFDMGPSWYMMPEIFDKFLLNFNKKVSDYYELLRLPVHYKVFFDQNRSFNIVAELHQNIKTFEKIETGAGQKLNQYLQESKQIYDRAMEELVYFDYDNLLELAKPELLPYLYQAKFFQNLHQYVARFFKNPDLQKIIEFTTVFLGGSPYITPAFYRLISHTDFNLGIWYPQGGMVKIFEMLTTLAHEQGVAIKLNQEVVKIQVTNGKADLVQTKNNTYPADIVVSGADYWWTETRLLDQQWRQYKNSYWQTAITSPSAFIIYLGTKNRVKNFDHHNLYFNDSWEKGFEAVYTKQQWPEEPSYYVHVPSISDRSLCPKNGDALMILVPVAAGLKDDTTTRTKFSQQIIKHLEQLTDNDLHSNIAVKRIFAHQDFITEYHSLKGCAFGLAHTLKQTALFRPKNRSKKVKNLFYAGQNTNPGVGVPTSIISAMIVDKMVKKLF